MWLLPPSSIMWGSLRSRIKLCMAMQCSVERLQAAFSALLGNLFNEFDQKAQRHSGAARHSIVKYRRVSQRDTRLEDVTLGGGMKTI
jgi:hypothetical protein